MIFEGPDAVLSIVGKIELETSAQDQRFRYKVNDVVERSLSNPTNSSISFTIRSKHTTACAPTAQP